ncbi:MAG: flagellin lysine-N-methylase [Clostridia bacterium]|nr:flagellin lysine-N-methylase [Clostridia bacterium]
MAYINAIAPNIYPNFVCKCGECRHVCCKGWRIGLPMLEYFKLIGRDCSPELRRRLDVAFEMANPPSPDRYALIAPDYEGKCRLLNDKGYCSVQLECGENAIPTVCRLYPRAIKRPIDGDGLPYELTVSLGCENTVELLMALTDKVSFSAIDASIGDGTPPEDMDIYNSKDNDARKACLDIMLGNGKAKDKLALLAKHLTDVDIASASLADSLRAICMIINAYAKNSINVQEFCIPALRGIGITDKSTDDCLNKAAEEYKKRAVELQSKIPNFDLALTNILANHLFYEKFPVCDSSTLPKDALIALFAAYGLFMFTATVNSYGDESIDSFVDSTAGVFRLVEHSDFYRTAPLLLKRLKIDDLSLYLEF